MNMRMAVILGAVTMLVSVPALAQQGPDLRFHYNRLPPTDEERLQNTPSPPLQENRSYYPVPLGRSGATAEYGATAPSSPRGSDPGASDPPPMPQPGATVTIPEDAGGQ